MAQLLPHPKIRIAHKKDDDIIGRNNKGRYAVPKAIKVIDLPEKKKLESQTKRVPAKQKSCTDSPQAKKAKARCPIASMTKMRTSARPHPSQSSISNSAQSKANNSSASKKKKKESL